MRPGTVWRNVNAQTNPQNSKPISPHVSFYKFYGRPLVRVFLMTSVTYYSLHYLWWYLDYDEMTATKGREIGQLEDELARVTVGSKEKRHDKIGVGILALPKELKMS